MAKNFLTGLRLVNLASDPVSGSEGELYFNTTDDVVKIYANGSWTTLTGGGGGGGNSFTNIGTSPSTQLITADSSNDTLTLISGSNIYIDANSSTDSITINVTGLQEQIDNLIGSIGPSSASATASRLTAYVKNGSTALAKGVPVYVTGADGTNIVIGPASNTAESSSSKTLGFTQTALNANQHGYIVLEGQLTGLNTDSANIGDPMWLGSSPGEIIYGLANKPKAPNHLVYLGVVTRKNSSNGEIFVKIQNGFELEELHNVRITSASASDIIIYNSASSLWLNQPIQTYLTSASNAAFTSASTYSFNLYNDVVDYVDENLDGVYYALFEEGANYVPLIDGIAQDLTVINNFTLSNTTVDFTDATIVGLVIDGGGVTG